MSHPATGVRRRTRLLAGLAAVGLVTGLGLAATPTHAEDSPPTSPPSSPHTTQRAVKSASINGTARLRSTKRKKLAVTVSASSSATGGRLTVSLNLKGEEHAWTFKVPKNSLKLNAKGAGRLVTKKRIKPFGTIKLRIAPKGKWKTKKCQGKVISKRRSLKLTGLFKFDSKSAWGKVGGKKVRFAGGSVVRTTGNDGSACSGGDGGGGGDADDPCPSAVGSWFSYDRKGTGFSSGWTPNANRVSLIASRSVKLKRPKGATRSDFRAALVPKPQVSISGSAVTLKVRTKAPAVGSATLSGTGVTFAVPCETTRSYDQSSWFGLSHQNAAKRLTMRMSVYGAIRVPNHNLAGVLYNTAGH